MILLVVSQQCRITCSREDSIARCDFHKAPCHCPIPLTRITPLICTPSWYSTFYKIVHARSRKFPAFPYAHTYAPAKPFINSLQGLPCICVFEVADPATDCVMQHLLASFIAHSVTPHRKQFQFGFELGKRLRMDAKPSNTATSCIE